MNALDIVILCLIASLAVLGYAQGFIVGFASLFGVALGGIVGTRLAQWVLERAATDAQASAWAPVLGLAVGLLVTIVGALAMQDLGSELRIRLATNEHVAIDRALGAVLLAFVGLIFVWFTAASAIGMPQLREYRGDLVSSRVISNLNRILPPAGPVLGAISSYDPFPEFDGGRISVAPPDEALPEGPEVRAAARSVVRIIGSACGYTVTGSGWVAANDYVVTNAHVIAGEGDTDIQLSGGRGTLDADVVYFDAVNDVAILRVTDLDARVLQTAAKPSSGTAGVVIGFPENRGLTSTAARYSDERTVRGADIYGNGEHSRRVSSFRGLVRHGNSGGPVIDGAGRVLTTVFASTVGNAVKGGYGVPNSIVGAALATAKRVPEGYGVRTGACIS